MMRVNQVNGSSNNQENFTQISMSYNPNIWIELCQMQRLQITGIMKNYPEYWMAFFPWNQHTLFRKNKVRDTPDVEKEDLLIFLNVIIWGGICMCVFAFKNNQLSRNYFISIMSTTCFFMWSNLCIFNE